MCAPRRLRNRARELPGDAELVLPSRACQIAWAGMSRFTDTIAALATPVGTSAVAVIRVSGPDTPQIVQDIFGAAPLPRHVRRGNYRDLKGAVLDDVLFVLLQEPKSYTGEPTLEISGHGNPFIAQKILEDLFARGCRPANPGEFTQRAFLNGRMELSQAEAVMDLIHAQSDRALEAANQQLRGALGRRIETLVTRLLSVIAYVEAYIDFPEEDLPAEDQTRLGTQIDSLLNDTKALLATERYGTLLRDGIKTAIVGAPNVGKSSLLNRLVGRERALVSAEPGTTRDFIEERLIVGAYCLRLIDTAGLNITPSALENLGMDKTMEVVADADLVIGVADAEKTADSLPSALRVFLKPGRALIVVNKIDLTPSVAIPSNLEGVPIVPISALMGIGLEDLSRAITKLADAFRPTVGSDLTAINARHAHALESTRHCLHSARDKITSGEPLELLAGDLRGALAGLEEIGGKVDNERMLDQLFATFCIGK